MLSTSQQTKLVVREMAAGQRAIEKAQAAATEAQHGALD